MTGPVLDLDPPARQWASLIDFDPSRHADERQRFGLPTDRPIIMAGHQGTFWHAGIAAKLFAAQALADQIGGAVAWLVIDTDDAKPTELRVPFRDDEGRLTERTIRVDRDTIGHHRATKAAEAYAQHGAEESPEVRATLATLDLLPGPAPTLIRSSKLSESARFRHLVGRFRHSATSARSEYNTALERHPDSGMTPLRGEAMPFWRVTPSGARLPARKTDLEGRLWPRALATTGVVRASLCDLFIHGTGGRRYEPINDHWLGDSLGWTLAPFVTASATLYLRFDGDAISATQARRAVWRAHHAMHHPDLLGDAAAEDQRTQLIARIADLPRGDTRRAALFAELHGLLARVRAEHAETLRELVDHAAALAARSQEHDIRNDRTWPAALHKPEDLVALCDAVAASFA